MDYQKILKSYNPQPESVSRQYRANKAFEKCAKIVPMSLVKQIDLSRLYTTAQFSRFLVREAAKNKGSGRFLTFKVEYGLIFSILGGWGCPN